jgi:hypothetical protein
MNDNSSVDAPDRRRSEWPFRFLVLLVAAGVLYVFLWHGLAVFGAISENLPLLLPLAVTVLSIFTRATDVRTTESVLKFSNDIAIGIISFDIWALSASRSDPSGRIMVNKSTMISGDLVLPFLLAGLLLAVGCVVLTNYSFKTPEAKLRWLLVGFVAAVVVYLAPFGVKRPVTTDSSGVTLLAVHRFAVVIPYQDPDIISLAPTFLRNKKLMQLEDSVLATSDSAAASIGLQRFLTSPASDRVRPKPGGKVEIKQAEILVVPR